MVAVRFVVKKQIPAQYSSLVRNTGSFHANSFVLMTIHQRQSLHLTGDEFVPGQVRISPGAEEDVRLVEE